MYALKSATLILGVAALAAPASAQYPFISGIGAASMMYAFDPYGQSYLGVDTEDITADRVAALKLKQETGVEIRQVDQDAPAGKAGLKKYDVILEFNGTRVDSAEQLRRMIHETPAGRTVTLNISRDGQPLTITVQLVDYHKWAPAVARITPPPLNSKGFGDNMPNFEDLPELRQPEMPWPGYTSRAGMIVENLTPQLGEFLGAKDGKGVLVRSVEQGSEAETAGVKAGDVVRKIGSRTVANRWDFRLHMDAHKSGKLNILVLRDKREQTITITLNPNQSRNNGFSPDLEDLEAQLRPLIEDAERNAMQATGDGVLNAQQFQKEWDKHKAEIEAGVHRMQEAQRYWDTHKDEIQRQVDRTMQEMQKQMQDLDLHEFRHFD